MLVEGKQIARMKHFGTGGSYEKEESVDHELVNGNERRSFEKV